jgi:hypothetical protein
MGQGGGAGKYMLPPGFILTGTSQLDGPEAADIVRPCGCHTTPWVESEVCGHERRWVQCPMHDQQARRKAARRLQFDMAHASEALGLPGLAEVWR